MKKLFIITLIFNILGLSFNVKAQDNNNSLWDKFKTNVSQTWQDGNYNLFIPINTWHNRLTYDKEKIDEYNEMPWGLGIGKGRYDSDGDWHGLYAIVFEDSNYHPKPYLAMPTRKIGL